MNKSKLQKFTLYFEYDKTIAEERKKLKKQGE